MQTSPITVAAAVRRGTLIVNGPVMALLAVPGLLVVMSAKPLTAMLGSRDAVSSLTLATFALGFVLAWTWWSLSVPRWRLWAYERVDDIPALKAHAIRAGLIWPDGSVFQRTEIRSAEMARRIRELESASDGR